MRIVVYGPDRRVGAIDGNDVIDLSGAVARLGGVDVPSDLEQFILQGDRAIETAQRGIDHVKSAGDRTVFTPLSSAQLRAPLAHRGVKICMAGANYADHAFDMARRQNPNVTMEEVREAARQRGIAGFWKLPDFVTDPYADVTYPAKARYLDYEGEVTIVLGRDVKDFHGSDAKPYIWGYTLQNDWSARDIGDAALGGLSWSSQKNWDCSSTIGPCIVVGEIGDPHNVDFQTTVDGQVRQQGNTKNMTFTFAEYLEHMTRDITFRAGDMIAAGTCKGTAMDQTPRVTGEAQGATASPQGIFESDKLFLRIGQTVEVSSPQIGILRNRIVSK